MDMERPRPMERLVCGDVGYGKTEVAMRAAFKAVYDNKQVAVLVPTTVLAQQHYDTFQRRFAPYAVHIGLLSRLRGRKEQQQVLAGLRQGTVDIVIGTHRLLQKDVQFKNLGLLVVDEEHRFGVAHKKNQTPQPASRCPDAYRHADSTLLAYGHGGITRLQYHCHATGRTECHPDHGDPLCGGDH